MLKPGDELKLRIRCAAARPAAWPEKKTNFLSGEQVVTH
jgi:hypothetical protein